jgi:hypothetical protein
MVATVAAARMEATSSIIQSFEVPRCERADSATRLPSHSWEEAIEAESLCQNSEVAICVFKTSMVQKDTEKPETRAEGKTAAIERRLQK